MSSPFEPGKTFPMPCPDCAHPRLTITCATLEERTNAPLLFATCDGCAHEYRFRLESMTMGTLDPADADKVETVLRFPDTPTDADAAMSKILRDWRRQVLG